MGANCEPPLTITRLRKQVCQTSSPERIERAPNEAP